jgi:hypothetical protein
MILMDISNIKDLKAIIELCRKTGVTHIKTGELELTVSLKDNTERRPRGRDLSLDFPEANISVPQPNLPIKAVADKIATDELTPEQLLFYSSAVRAEQ